MNSVAVKNLESKTKQRPFFYYLGRIYYYLRVFLKIEVGEEVCGWRECLSTRHRNILFLVGLFSDGNSICFISSILKSVPETSSYFSSSTCAIWVRHCPFLFPWLLMVLGTRSGFVGRYSFCSNRLQYPLYTHFPIILIHIPSSSPSW